MLIQKEKQQRNNRKRKHKSTKKRMTKIRLDKQSLISNSNNIIRKQKFKLSWTWLRSKKSSGGKYNQESIKLDILQKSQGTKPLAFATGNIENSKAKMTWQVRLSKILGIRQFQNKAKKSK